MSRVQVIYGRPDVSGGPKAVCATNSVNDVWLNRALQQGAKLAILIRHQPGCSFSTCFSGGLRLASRRHNLQLSQSWTGGRSSGFRASSGKGDPSEGNGDEDMQELLVEMLRLQTGKARVDEFVEDRSKFLTEIADQPKEEFKCITEEARKTMDEPGFKVLDQNDADAAGFEEELAAARAKVKANELDLDQLEKSVEQARSEGLFFKNLFAKPTRPWKARSPEEQEEIKETVRVVTQDLYQTTKRTAASKFRRAAYGVWKHGAQLELENGTGRRKTPEKSYGCSRENS